MHNTININIAIAALVLGFSIVGSKISRKIGVPTLLIFILIGIFVKVSKVTNLHLEDAWYQENTKILGIATLIFILFSGGLETEKSHIRAVWKSGLLLSTLGTLLTAVFTGGLLYYASPLFGARLSIKQSVLVTAILASTDAAAVFSILRSRKMKLKANIGPLLELESGSNDVMVYFLMTFLLTLLKDPTKTVWGALPFFALEMSVGALGGVVVGYAMVWILNKINLPHEGLYPALTIALIFLAYGAISLLHGSGYLAIYTAGIILGNRDFLHRNAITKFYEGFGWLLQILMFIALGLLVKTEILQDVAPLGVILALAIMFLARPVSVFIALFFSSFTKKQKTFIAWVGLRGAVPIVFATYLYGKEGLGSNMLAEKLFHLIFFVVLISILVQGSTLYPFAKLLNLHVEKRFTAQQKKSALDIEEDVKKMLIQLEIPDNSPVHEKAVVNIGFPKESFIALVYRDKRYFRVKGSTVLHAHDKLFVVVNTKKELKAVKTLLGIS